MRQVFRSRCDGECVQEGELMAYLNIAPAERLSNAVLNVLSR